MLVDIRIEGFLWCLTLENSSISARYGLKNSWRGSLASSGMNFAILTFSSGFSVELGA